MCSHHLSNFYVPPEGPPQGLSLPSDIYVKMGEDNIFKMLEDFYQELEHSSIRHMFPGEMKEASKKSAAFFVQICGGPPLYNQQYGSPRMRQRHMAFPIDEGARQVWLQCFSKVLEHADIHYAFPMEYRDQFWNFLEKFSAWMVNTQ